MVMPAAITNSAIKKGGNVPSAEAGANKRQPAAVTLSPRTAPRIYPILDRINAAGSEKKLREAAKMESRVAADMQMIAVFPVDFKEIVEAMFVLSQVDR